jgi:hypothetical protein
MSKASFTHSRIRCQTMSDANFSLFGMIRCLKFLTPVLTWSFHGGDTDNDSLIYGCSRMSTDKQGLSLLCRYPLSSVTSHVLSRINPCTIRIHLCSSLENTRTWLVPVFKRSLRWLHGTFRFIHGINTVDFLPEWSGRKIKHVWYFALTPGWSQTSPGACTVCTRCITDHHGLSQTIMDCRDDMASHPWMCKRGLTS